MQSPVLMGSEGPLGPRSFHVQFPEALDTIIVEFNHVDSRNAVYEAGSHKILQLYEWAKRFGASRIDRRHAHTTVVGVPKTAGGDFDKAGRVVRKPLNGQGSYIVILFPCLQPVLEDRPGFVAHLQILVNIKETYPMMFRAVILDTSCRYCLLQMLSLLTLWVDRVRPDVSESYSGVGDIVPRLEEFRVILEFRGGPIVVDVETADAVMVVVVCNKLPELRSGILYHEAYLTVVRSIPSKWLTAGLTNRHVFLFIGRRRGRKDVGAVHNVLCEGR